jgi:hypothetical protein
MTFYACEKEGVLVPEKEIFTEPVGIANSSSSMLVEAQNVFNNGGKTDKAESKSISDLLPVWKSAREIVFQGNDTLLLVPYWLKENVVQSSHENIYLVFFNGDNGVMDFNIIGFESTEETLSNRSLDALNGYIFVGRDDFSVSHVAEVIDGTLVSVAYDKDRLVFDQMKISESTGNKSCEENLISFNPWEWLRNLFHGDRVVCPSPSGNRRTRNSRSSWLANFFTAIGDAFGSTTGNSTSGSNSNGATFWGVFGRILSSRGGVSVASGSSGNGGGGLNTDPSGNGGPLNISDFYEELKKAPVVEDLVNLMDECLTDGEDQQAALDLIQDEYLKCVNHFGEIGNPNLLIQQYLCTSASVLDQLESRGLSSPCAVNSLKARTIQLLLNDPYARFVELKGDPVMTSKIWDFIQENDLDETSKDYVSLFFDMKDEDSDYKWERFGELWGLVGDNADALVTGCGPSRIADWAYVANYKLSGPALERIENSGFWAVQGIDNANNTVGKRVNLDYFSVEIEQPPIINGTRLTPQETFDYFRKNINNFADKFTPHSPLDASIWQSNNPLTAVMGITMMGDPAFNFIELVDGDVICSEYTGDSWMFTTLFANPVGGNGYHPVSGNRRFGYFMNDAGNLNIYTQGVDRTTTWYHSLANGIVGFALADELWKNMQANFIVFIEANRGAMSTNTPTHENVLRPNWSAARELLKSSQPITQIPCN